MSRVSFSALLVVGSIGCQQNHNGIIEVDGSTTEAETTDEEQTTSAGEEGPSSTGTTGNDDLPKDELPHGWDCDINPAPGEVVGCVGMVRMRNGQAERFVDFPTDNPYEDELERAKVDLYWNSEAGWQHATTRVSNSGHFRFSDVPELPLLLISSTGSLYAPQRKFDFLTRDRPSARTVGDTRIDVDVIIDRTGPSELPFSALLSCPNYGSLGDVYSDEGLPGFSGKIYPEQFGDESRRFSDCFIWPYVDSLDQVNSGWHVELEPFDYQPGSPLALKGVESFGPRPKQLAVNWQKPSIQALLSPWTDEGLKVHQLAISHDEFAAPGDPHGSSQGDSAATLGHSNEDGDFALVPASPVQGVSRRQYFFYQGWVQDDTHWSSPFARYIWTRSYQTETADGFDLMPRLPLPSGLRMQGKALQGPGDGSLEVEEGKTIRIDFDRPLLDGEPVWTSVWVVSESRGLVIISTQENHIEFPERLVDAGWGYSTQLLLIQQDSCGPGRDYEDCDQVSVHFFEDQVDHRLEELQRLHLAPRRFMGSRMHELAYQQLLRRLNPLSPADLEIH